MKNQINITLLAFILGFLGVNAYGQNSIGTTDDFGKIIINAYIPPQVEGLPPAARSLLQNKLSQIALSNGLGADAFKQRFIITPNISVVSKNITPTAPPMVAVTLDVSFYIGDGIDGTLFSTTTIEVRGAGTNKAKAYISALSRINPHNPDLTSMVEQGKNKIIQYYNTNCEFIKTNAMALAQKKEYDRAISNLVIVPEVCKECYESSQNLSVKIYNMKMENECSKNIQLASVAEANNNWEDAANYLSTILPNVSCYKKAQTMLKSILDHRCSDFLAKARGYWAVRNYEMAARFLSQVPDDSKCAGEAKNLYSEISTKMNANEKRDWNFMYEKYNRQQTFKETKGFELQKAQIKEARDVGVAYGRSQPRTVTYVTPWFK